LQLLKEMEGCTFHPLMKDSSSTFEAETAKNVYSRIKRYGDLGDEETLSDDGEAAAVVNQVQLINY